MERCSFKSGCAMWVAMLIKEDWLIVRISAHNNFILLLLMLLYIYIVALNKRIKFVCVAMYSIVCLHDWLVMSFNTLNSTLNN